MIRYAMRTTKMMKPHIIVEEPTQDTDVPSIQNQPKANHSSHYCHEVVPLFQSRLPHLAACCGNHQCLGGPRQKDNDLVDGLARHQQEEAGLACSSRHSDGMGLGNPSRLSRNASRCVCVCVCVCKEFWDRYILHAEKHSQDCCRLHFFVADPSAMMMMDDSSGLPSVTIAAGAYIPEEGYGSLDLSLPKYDTTATADLSPSLAGVTGNASGAATTKFTAPEKKSKSSGDPAKAAARAKLEAQKRAAKEEKMAKTLAKMEAKKAERAAIQAKRSTVAQE